MQPILLLVLTVYLCLVDHHKQPSPYSPASRRMSERKAVIRENAGEGRAKRWDRRDQHGQADYAIYEMI